MKPIYSYPAPLHERIITLIGEGYSDRQVAAAIDDINYQYVFRFRRSNGILPGSIYRKKPRKLALPMKLRYEKQPIIDFCLTLPGVFEDTPFHDKRQIAIRHKSNRKSFAFIYEYNGRLCVNIKCDPTEAVIFRHRYENVIRPYLMNKASQNHWVTVVVGGDVSEQKLHEMIRRGYDLTQSKVKAMSEKEYLKKIWGIDVRETFTNYNKRTYIKEGKTNSRTRSQFNDRIKTS